MRWLVESGREKERKIHFPEKLAKELLDASRNEVFYRYYLHTLFLHSNNWMQTCIVYPVSEEAGQAVHIIFWRTLILQFSLYFNQVAILFLKLKNNIYIVCIVTYYLCNYIIFSQESWQITILFQGDMSVIFFPETRQSMEST